MLKTSTPATHTHNEVCTGGCTADKNTEAIAVADDKIINHVKGENACQHNIILALNKKQDDEGELKIFFDRFDPPPPPCNSETKPKTCELENDFLTNIEGASSLSALAKLIVEAEIDCQAELFMIKGTIHNKRNLWSNIKNMATKISQTMIIPTVEKQALPNLNDLSSLIKKQTSLEDLQTKLNDGAIKHSGIKDILTTDTSGKINLTEGLPETEKKELEKKITEYKNNTDPKKDTGLFMEIIAWFAKTIGKLFGRVDELEKKLTTLEKQQKQLDKKKPLFSTAAELRLLAKKIPTNKTTIPTNHQYMTFHDPKCNIFNQKDEDDNLTDKAKRNKEKYLFSRLKERIQNARDNIIGRKYNYLDLNNLNKGSSCRI